MSQLTEQVLKYAERLPEGTPVATKSLLQLGNRAAVDQVLSRLTSSGHLIRAARGIYVRPINGRFGTRAPSVKQVVEGFASQWGEVIATSGAVAAHALGLTTQVPIRNIYLTSGRNRSLSLGQQVVELRHAPRWQLTAAQRQPGQVIGALAWLGPEEAEGALDRLKQKLPQSTFEELVAVAPQLPTWLAQAIGRAAHVAHS